MKRTVDFGQQICQKYAIILWIIISVTVFLLYVPLIRTPEDTVITIFLSTLIIVSVSMYYYANKGITNSKKLITHSKIMLIISLLILLGMIILSLNMTILTLNSNENQRGVLVGYMVAGLAPIFILLITGFLSFLIASIKLKKLSKTTNK